MSYNQDHTVSSPVLSMFLKSTHIITYIKFVSFYFTVLGAQIYSAIYQLASVLKLLPFVAVKNEASSVTAASSASRHGCLQAGADPAWRERLEPGEPLQRLVRCGPEPSGPRGGEARRAGVARCWLWVWHLLHLCAEESNPHPLDSPGCHWPDVVASGQDLAPQWATLWGSNRSQ